MTITKPWILRAGPCPTYVLPLYVGGEPHGEYPNHRISVWGAIDQLTTSDRELLGKIHFGARPKHARTLMKDSFFYAACETNLYERHNDEIVLVWLDQRGLVKIPMEFQKDVARFNKAKNALLNGVGK